MIDFIKQYRFMDVANVVLAFAEKIPAESWSQAKVAGSVESADGEVNINIRRCSLFHLSQHYQSMPIFADIDRLLFQTFSECLNRYVQDLGDLGKFVINSGVTEDEGYTFLRYGGGEFYNSHVDSVASKYPRTLTSLLYLNNTYEGGEIIFPVQDVVIKPDPGSLVIFPSAFTHPHIVCPVKNGIRYCVVTWFK